MGGSVVSIKSHTQINNIFMYLFVDEDSKVQ